MREDVRTKKALQRLVGHRTVTMKAIADDLGVAYRTVANWCEPEGTVPTLSQVRQIVWAAAHYDRAFATELAADLFGLADAGWLLSTPPAPAVDSTDLVGEVMQAGAAVGAVTGWAVEATSDRSVSPVEADLGWHLIRKAQRELAEAQAVVDRLRARSPQTVMAAVLQ